MTQVIFFMTKFMIAVVTKICTGVICLTIFVIYTFLEWEEESKMRKLMVLILSVFALTFLLSGCSGGGNGGGGSDSGQATYSLHFQDQNQTAMAGVVLHYTDPAGHSCTTAASDRNGNLTIIFKQAGSYPVNNATLANGTEVQTSGVKFDIPQGDIDGKITKSFLIKIDTSDPNHPVYDRQAIYILHFQDQNGTALAGVVLRYTDPSGQSHNTEASDTGGNLTIVFDRAGSYPISGTALAGGTVVHIPAGIEFDVPQDDIDDNVTKEFRVKINTTANPPELIAYDEIK
jgi:hypothetical protein